MSDKNFKVKNGIDAAGKLTITNTSGTDSLIEVNGAGGGQFTVTPYGGISTNAGFQSIGGPSYFGGYGGTTSVVVNVTGASGQTGDLQRWTTFSGTVLAKVDSTGSISATDLTLSGNLTVNGTTTNLNSTNLVIEDKNIIIADVATPTDTTADGAGITIKGATDKTLNWVQSTGSFTSSEPFIINSNSASSKPLIIKAAASQTANLQEWQNNSGTVLASINSSGTIFTLNGGTSGVGATGRINLGDGYITKSYGGDMIFYGGLQSASEASIGTYTTNYNSTLAILALNNRIGAVIRSGSSQTTDLQQWQNNSGGILARVDQNGNIFATNNLFVRNGGNDYGAAVNFGTGFNGTRGLVLRGVASQTANLMEWQNSAATVLTSVDASGNITAPSYNLSDSKYLLRKTIKKTVDPAQNAVANNTYDLFDMNFPSSLQGTFYIQASIRGGGYGQNLTYSLPATYAMDWINQYAITNPFTNSTTWVDLTPLTFSPRHLMTNDYFKFQAKVNANQISFRIKLTGTLTGAPVFDIYIQHSEEFANSTITELNTTGTDATTSNVMPNSLSSKAGLSAIFNPITLYSNSASNTPLTIKGFASQTADILQIQDSGGAARAIFERGGALSVQPSTALNGYTGFFKSPSSSVAGLMVRGAASQSANLQEWQNSSGTVLTKINSNGALSLSNATLVTSESSNIGDKIGLYSNAFGFGIDYGRTVAFVSAVGDAFAVRVAASSGTASFGSDAVALFGNGSVVQTLSSASTVGLIIKGAASQTANLTEWHNSSGTLMAAVKADGSFRAGGANGATKFLVDQYGTLSLGTDRNNTGTPTYLFVQSQLTTDIGAVIKGASSQTANLQEWQNSSGTVLSSFSSNGRLAINTTENAGGRALYVVQPNGGYGSVFAGVGTIPNVTIYAASGGVGLLVAGAVSQTANLQEWQNSSGTVLGRVDSFGALYLSETVQIGPGTADQRIAGGGLTIIHRGGTSSVTFGIKAIASQTGDLTQWRNSSNTIIAKVDANGNFFAISKSFDILHPTKENMRLRHGSLEGPENGVYIRGTTESNIIELPEYWTGLVHKDSITVSLTAVGSAQNIYVEKIEDNKVYIGGELIKAFFTVYGERKDIDKLTVEY